MFVHVDRFDSRPLLSTTAPAAGTRPNDTWRLTGTNAADANVTVKAAGGWLVESAGAANDQAIVVPHNSAGVSRVYGATWGTTKGCRVRWTITGGGTTTAQRFEAGVRTTMDAFDDTTDDDKVLIRSVDGGNFFVVSSAGGTDVTEDTGVPWETTRAYVVDLWVADGDAPSLLVAIGGVVVNTRASHPLTAATSLGLPFAGIEATGAAKKGWGLVEVRLGQGLG